MRWNTQQKLKSVVVLFICLPLTTLLAGCSNNASSQGNAQTARPTQTISTTQSIVITAIDYTYSMPTTLTLHAGLVDLTLINNGTQPHQAQFARLNPGVTRDQVVEQLITKRDQAAAFSLLTLQVQNQGTEPHELNIVRLNTGKNLHDILSFFRALYGGRRSRNLVEWPPWPPKALAGSNWTWNQVTMPF